MRMVLTEKKLRKLQLNHFGGTDVLKRSSTEASNWVASDRKGPRAPQTVRVFC